MVQPHCSGEYPTADHTLYFCYTTRPKCANGYGKNYVVAVPGVTQATWD